MGNAQSLVRTSGALDSFVTELGSDVVYERSLGSARFLKTVKCRHKNGYLVVKIFIKPDPGLSLRKYHRRLKQERDALADIPNVYTYQSFVETDKAGYLVRQWVASSLYDRISTRPFLSHIEKKWLAYQLLTALRDARNRKIAHGDLKTSNILITSWNWLLVSDFAPHKPAYLPLDDPADFSFFFDTSGRRTCYIAPERFYSADEDPEASRRRDKEREREGEGKREGRVTEAMDCFSAGCVLAELFLEGTPLFSLSQLFKYRAGELNLDAQLATIDDEGVRDLIKSMIAIDPAQRPTFDSLLHNARGTVFPETFYSFLHNYVASVNELSSPSPFSFPNPSHPSTTAATPTNATPTTAKPPALANAALPGLSSDGDRLTDQLPSDSDHRMERLWSDYESVEPYLLPTAGSEDLEDTVKDPVRIEFATPNVAGKPLQDIFPVELEIPNRDSKLLKGYGDGRKAAKEDGPALILLALLTANIRTCNLPSSKLRALDVCLALAPLLTDEAKLDRMVPYIVELLQDEAPTVRSAAVRTLMQVLMLVTVITPSNASIFPEYIIPALSPLVRDPEVSVRCMYAQCVVALADTAVRYLEMGQALRAHGAYKIGATAALTEGQDYDETHFEVSYDASMQELQNAVQEQLSALLVDPSPVVKRSILHNISALCIFLGKQRTNDVLLSHMITYLNDRDWLLRYAFFDSIVEVAACAGGRSLEDYILPLMIQALSDVEETVVARVLASLRSLCELGLFQKMRIWELLSATLAFLYHPNIWIRQGAAAFIAAAAKHLPPSDVWCILYPSLKHFLRSDIQDVDERSLLLALKPPLPRHIFDAAKSWAKTADKSVFWRTQRAVKTDSPKDSLASVRPNAASRSRNEEDETQMTKLQQLGMTTMDESKLHAMRDFISKLARNIASFETRVRVEPEVEGLKVSSTIELQKLGVVPQTVFLKASNDTITTPRSARPLVAQRAVSELVRSPILSGTPRSHRTMSADFSLGAPGAPFEDLRRRLAIINGSATSVSATPTTRDIRSPSVPVVDSLTPTSSNTAVSDVPLERPSSPTDSVVSGANSSFGAHRLHLGSIHGQKALPAVGSSKANATGVLESHPQLRDGSPERSGRSSPVSLAGTIRGERPRISTLVPISTYDGQEPGISNLLEHMYLENNRDSQADFGPRVHEGPVRRRNAARHSYMPRDGSNRRLETSLIANLTSHTDAVTCLAVSPDHMFFVSASDDKTVKVWDTARLERNVTSKPRHTYNQHHARVKAICFVEATHCFVSAAEDGSIYVVRVHVSGNQGQGGGLPKYGKLQTIREHRLDVPGQYVTCMAHYNTATASNLLYGTTHSVISILDLRTSRVLQTMENPRHYGPITCLCLDRKRTWVVCGTATGVLSLWDLRFGILIKSWRTGAAAQGKSARIHQCVVHPTKGKGRWIVVALEGSKSASSVGAEGTAPAATTLVEVWDIERSVLVESFATRTAHAASAPVPEPQAVAAQGAEASPAAALAALVRARQDGGGAPGDFVASRRRGSAAPLPLPVEAPSPDVRALVLGAEFGGHGALFRSPMADADDGALARAGARGFMLCASEDRRIRLWDLGKPERSVVLSGPDADSERPVYSAAQAASGAAAAYVETWVSSPSASQANRPPQRLSLINHNQQNLLKAHQDTINALVCIDSPFRGGIVSGDRAGVIKVWRVESAES
ncbi:Pkinase-domain-containing protein [Phanerochaete sordida]|uniref:non-specific serine/threonine protein kinase n=1 Tax=Phanerochaete sordida TaxID=48140 RepID=A0A9P3G287_9APHY|nr:Pkinase-domain-containing protein [Phanerochaete sordida]